MKADKKHIEVVWLKRDLRLEDNEAIFNALQTKNQTLLLYVFENILLDNEHYSERHVNFIKESLVDINKTLEYFNSRILVVKGNIVDALENLTKYALINQLHSHQETGISITFKRDKEVASWCKKRDVNWIETINNGVQRGLKNRTTWFADWNHYMSKPLVRFNPEKNQLVSTSEIELLENNFKKLELQTPENPYVQKGGRSTALKYADSFFNERHKQYMFHISKPDASRKSCSRLSPYIAWGNLSVREVFQRGKLIKANSNHKRHLSGFLSRLRWQAHFVQKFEMECSMEFTSVNKGYHQLNKTRSIKLQEAWKTGQTGFPLVDAAMRCLNQTGYINFRLRALLVSFFTHALWQPWQDAASHLAQQFLDFEPGIHFPQLQMQAAETGINNIRIYSPAKNALDHDPEAIFIKKWVPELANLENHFALSPQNITPLESQFYNFNLGIDYPQPIIDFDKARKKAVDVLFNMKKNSLVKKENKRILSKHTLPNRKIMLQSND